MWLLKGIRMQVFTLCPLHSKQTHPLQVLNSALRKASLKYSNASHCISLYPGSKHNMSLESLSVFLGILLPLSTLSLSLSPFLSVLLFRNCFLTISEPPRRYQYNISFKEIGKGQKSWGAYYILNRYLFEISVLDPGRQQFGFLGIGQMFKNISHTYYYGMKRI